MSKWWDVNWPVLEGCSKVSAGCKNCFAERYVNRFRKSVPAFEGLLKDGHWTGRVNMRPDKLDMPLTIKKPTRFFVAERSDLFHESVPADYVDKIFKIISQCPQHTFFILTKRPDRMKDYLAREADVAWTPYPNIILGVSVEDQKTADERIPLLLQIPAAKRFVSYEPALRAIKFNGYWLKSINQIIMGGESGPGARPLHPDWARSVRNQCHAAGIPFFFKQWGEWAPTSQVGGGKITHAMTIDGIVAPFNKEAMIEADSKTLKWEGLRRLGKHAAGCLIDGVLHKELP